MDFQFNSMPASFVHFRETENEGKKKDFKKRK